MPKTATAKKPMTPVDRRRKSDAAKLQRGERRLTNWINPEAAEALMKLTGGSEERGAIKEAIESALLKTAARVK